MKIFLKVYYNFFYYSKIKFVFNIVIKSFTQQYIKLVLRSKQIFLRVRLINDPLDLDTVNVNLLSFS